MELLGMTYFQQGELDEAGRCWREATELDPKNADAWLGLGRLAMSRRDYRAAVEAFSHAAECSPEALEPLYSLSQAHRLLNNPEAAEAFRRRADERRLNALVNSVGRDADVDGASTARTPNGSKEESGR
jgi:cytochrome c-type biogenesis protein CcmH/NrfG